MKIHATFIIILVVVAVVESCRDINPFQGNPSQRCDDWWKKASKYGADRNRAIKRCVVLVQNNCPGTVTTTVVLKHQQKVSILYTVWKTRNVAVYSNSKDNVEFTDEQTHDVCSDDDSGPGDCDAWCEAATYMYTHSEMMDRSVSGAEELPRDVDSNLR